MNKYERQKSMIKYDLETYGEAVQLLYDQIQCVFDAIAEAFQLALTLKNGNPAGMRGTKHGRKKELLIDDLPELIGYYTENTKGAIHDNS